MTSDPTTASKRTEPDDELEAHIEVLSAEVAYYFVDPADAFEDALAGLLGLQRPEGMADSEWRSMRVAYIDARDSEAERLSDQAAEVADGLIEERAAQWPYPEDEDHPG